VPPRPLSRGVSSSSCVARPRRHSVSCEQPGFVQPLRSAPQHRVGEPRVARDVQQRRGRRSSLAPTAGRARRPAWRRRRRPSGRATSSELRLAVRAQVREAAVGLKHLDELEGPVHRFRERLGPDSLHPVRRGVVAGELGAPIGPALGPFSAADGRWRGRIAHWCGCWASLSSGLLWQLWACVCVDFVCWGG
jgi:hypothetical protein